MAYKLRNEDSSESSLLQLSSLHVLSSSWRVNSHVALAGNPGATFQILIVTKKNQTLAIPSNFIKFGIIQLNPKFGGIVEVIEV
jgi:hypothetical protein